MIVLPVIWFFLLGVFLVMYAVLDGFDLGVGIWYLLSKTEKHKRTMLKTIGPVWDGNEVWIIGGGGVIFAAFPAVYATVFSGFYLAMMLVLFGLIFRAVSIEFLYHDDRKIWRGLWDKSFAIGSMVPALLFGVALGNLMRGVPLTTEGHFAGSFFSLLNPFSLLVGILGFTMFAMQGAQWLLLKTDGEPAEMAKGWLRISWLAFLLLFAALTLAVFKFETHLVQNFFNHPGLLGIPTFVLYSLFMVMIYNKKGNATKGFMATSMSIVGMMGLFAASVFPNLVKASNNPAWSLTLYNSSSSGRTLGAMLIIAVIGMPLVLTYTLYMYKTFWGKVDANAL